MNHGSVFTGVGDFDLAAEWIGWVNIFHCEIKPGTRAKLQKYWPNAKSYGDIKTTDFTVHRGEIDILTGGDPCQPHSYAGLGKGKDDYRYLWPEMFRAIRELHPAWIVNENVTGTVSNGILDIKIDDLESEGYACQTFNIPAASVGAMHERQRIWLIAYNSDYRAEHRANRIIQGQSQEKIISEQHQIQLPCEPVDLRFEYPNPDLERFEKQHFTEKSGICPEGYARYFGFGPYLYGNIPEHIIKSGIIRMLNGLPEGMDYTRRNERIKELGEAIVPQVAYELFKVINEINENEPE